MRDLLNELNQQGWARVAGIDSTRSLLDLSKSLGTPVAAPTGEIIKELRITEREFARPGTLSHKYGQGSFPFHTDTVFWSLPARYLVFRIRGDMRRSTLVKTFATLLQECGSRATELAERSVWRLITPKSQVYSSMTFRTSGESGWRYDTTYMRPANRAAHELDESVRINASVGECISWRKDEAVVVANWGALHGRGPAPANEGQRILERIYVR